MIGILLVACSAPAAPPAPVTPEPSRKTPPVVEPKADRAEATEVIKLMERCLHYAGEEPYDEQRAKQIAEGMEQSCGPALKRAPAVQAELAANPGSASALVDFIGYHGTVPGIEVDAALCARAALRYRGVMAKNGSVYAPYFGMVCAAEAEAVCGPTKCW